MSGVARYMADFGTVRIPFVLRRPWLLVTGLRVDREHPDLDHLRAIEDPNRFLWAILPHAARTFATSIVLLPARQAKTAAIAYLYCRMLDTYEDLSAPGAGPEAMEQFAARMRTLGALPPIPSAGRDDRDRAHLLLIERCGLVDAVFSTLPRTDREQIVDLVDAMASGMATSSRQMAAQGGVLVDREQVAGYCHHVIGEPALFSLLLLGESDLTEEQRRDALSSSELIQLANITRDVERDLERGIGYHSSLLPHLGRSDAAGAVREARRQLMAQALPQVSAYVRLAGQLAPRRFSPVRASAVVMLLHTDRHYRWCARRVGLSGWRGPRRTGTILLAALPAAVSRRWAGRIMRRVERDFLTTSDAL